MRKIDRVKKRFVEGSLEIALNGKESDRIYSKSFRFLKNYKIPLVSRQQ
jgi:hypothetical protein